MELQTEYIQNLRKKGYTEDFTSTSSYDLLSETGRIYRPHELKIAAYYKYAESSQDENFVLFAIETCDGKKGLLLDSCDENSEDRISRFIHVVTESRLYQKKHWFFSGMKNLFRFRFSSNL
jgi:hypothetical protein